MPQTISQKQLVHLFKDAKENNCADICFCFLLGAGASVSSGIPTGYELAKKWYASLKNDLLSESELKLWEQEIGFDENRIAEFYPQIYEKRFFSNRKMGYEEFKKLMEKADPDIGYVILSQILTKEHHNFVITTNFDYLVEDAVRMYTDKRPFSAGHEILASYISIHTDRPTIIKVHRDLFLHPFNDTDTTRYLREGWKKALTPLLKKFHILSIGYGGNDGSLMDYLGEINADDRKEIYWCKREDAVLNDNVQQLLTDKDYIVTITDFNHLMISINNALNYDIFTNLDTPPVHPFVINAQNHIQKLNEKLKELLKQREKETKDTSNEDMESLFSGAWNYILKARNEIEIDKKEQIFQEALNKYPDNEDVLFQYAYYLQTSRQDYDNAIKHYNKVIEIKPDDSDSWYNMGNAYVDKQDNDKALESYQKAIAIKTDDYDAWFNMGDTYAKKQDYEKAIKSYQNAIGIKPDDASTYCNLGFLYIKINEIEKAEQTINKAIELGDDIHSRMNLAHLFLIKNEETKALENYKTSLKNFTNPEKFFKAFDDDFKYLEQYGITKEKYSEIRNQLQTFINQPNP